MGFGDLTRINTNLQALRAMNALQNTNSRLGDHQLRLATGSRLNKAEDDSAGYSIAKKLEAKVRGQNQALANVGDAKSMLTVAEGSLNTIMDILQTMKEKSVQAANDSIGSEERDLIKNQLDALSSEVTDLLQDTTFNGVNLYSSNATSLQFQVNAESGDTFVVNIPATTVGAIGVNTSSLIVSSAASAGATISVVDNAITVIAARLGELGDNQNRLSFKQQNLETSITNYEAARSRIADADFAKEQMEMIKLQILQQTGTAALAQANIAPQSVLQLMQQ
ncbi:MAG TPA: flagellin [Rhodothermales bacterium]|nr:flagellin [Rhodothermales bacterium]